MHANHTFNHFLVSSGACSQEVADEFASIAMRSWKPLGQYLRESAGLTMRDMARVLGEQASQPTRVFGELAVELGVCTREQVADARLAQRRDCPHVIDLALADQRVDREKCLQAFAEYIRYAERLIDQLGQQFFDLVSPLARGSLF